MDLRLSLLTPPSALPPKGGLWPLLRCWKKKKERGHKNAYHSSPSLFPVRIPRSGLARVPLGQFSPFFQAFDHKRESRWASEAPLFQLTLIELKFRPSIGGGGGAIVVNWTEGEQSILEPEWESLWKSWEKPRSWIATLSLWPAALSLSLPFASIVFPSSSSYGTISKG